MNSFYAAGVACCVAASWHAQCCRAEDIDDGFVPIANVEAEAGDPATMMGYSLVDAAVLDNAVCLDGTPGLYYHRPGTGTGATKWYIHQVQNESPHLEKILTFKPKVREIYKR